MNTGGVRSTTSLTWVNEYRGRMKYNLPTWNYEYRGSRKYNILHGIINTGGVGSTTS